MPSWWGKSSSKDVKKKTNKENLIETLQRFIGSTDQKGTKSRVGQRHNNDMTSEKGSKSRAESRTTSPSRHVSRCQSFSARPHTHPLPLPGLHPGITRTTSEVITSKPILEKRGKPPLLLPLPQPSHTLKRPNNTDIDRDRAAAYVSSSPSTDTDDPADSQLQSPAGNAVDHRNRSASRNHFSGPQKDQSPIQRKNPSEIPPPPPAALFGNQILSSSPKQDIHGCHQVNGRNPRHGAVATAPDSLLSSPSRSPRRVIYPEQFPTSAFWGAKSNPDLTSSGQCSSAGSGQTSGHNSMGGEMLGQFWQHSRGSPEYSPIPSPRMASAGPSSRINSGAVSPLHPRAGGTAPESPKGLFEEGRKQSHRLPLPPLNITTPFHANNATANTSPPIPRSPGRTDTPASPGSRWKKGKLIGRGTFGHVYVGFNSESGEMCAMKEVTLFIDDVKSKESARQLGQEISLLSRLRHPNIVQYYGSEMIDDKLYIYLEYVSGGSIHKLLQEYGQLGEPAIRSYTHQILSGLSYLHAKNTVHRDIKGANILVDPNGRVKLADFGMAKHITGQSCPLSFKGSPYWMAPEVIKNSNGCNLAVDIWSLGCTVLEMATSKPPWSQFEGIAAMFKIGNGKELPAIPDHLSDDGKDFVRRCLQRDPSKRPAAAELLQHPFVKGAAPLERPLLYPEPTELITSVSAGTTTKGIGHARNLSSLDMEGLPISHPGGKTNIISSDARMKYISCPVSPIGSPLLNSRSPQHLSGRMSPSPISSPRAMSGASTPRSGGIGAVPFIRPKQTTYLNDVLTSSPRSVADLPLSGTIYREPKFDLSIGMQQGSPNHHERLVSETDVLNLNPQFGRVGYGNLWEIGDYMSHQVLRDHTKISPSLDLGFGASNIGRRNGL